jgi:hypothetical protein
MNYLHQAVFNLAKGSVYQMAGEDYSGLKWLEKPVYEGGQKKPTQAEVEAEVERLKEEYVNNQYQRNRAKAYPSITDQLDMLYHGGLDAWKEEINKIKQQYPKPVEG